MVIKTLYEKTPLVFLDFAFVKRPKCSKNLLRQNQPAKVGNKNKEGF